MPDSDLTVKDNEEYGNQKDPKVPVYVALVFLVLFIGLIGIVFAIDDILPTPLTISEEKTYPCEFIAERAQNDLKELIQLGPRVKGSPQNEIFTVKYLLNKIESIKNGASFNKKIDVDVQTVSGAYNFHEDDGPINVYEKVQNVVVKLYNERRSQESVLINVHFDSVPISPGGGDDGVNCVVALEVLRKLSKFSESFQYNLIFLFNGSEETPMQAAHGFITQHKWAKEAKVVINLEAAGATGKSMLFQIGPKRPWLLDYYRNAPHAYANVLGEELYISGLVPSDTDFRIFNAFGNISGLDFALVKDGYRYHTSYDGFYNVPAGTYQYIGDNTLSLAWNLANAKELRNVEEQPMDGVIYYDILTLFLISYTQTIAIIIHSVLAALILFIIVKSFRDFKLGFDKQSLLYLIITLAVVLLGWIVSAACILLIGVILDAISRSMSWYGSPWLLFGLYLVPIVICNSGLLVVLNRFNPIKPELLSASAHAQIQAISILFVWIILLLILTIVGLRSAFLIFLPVVFQSVMLAFINLFHLQEKLKIWPVIYIAGTILPNLALMLMAKTALEFMIPIAGRSGNYSNPEMLVGMLTFLLTLLITSFYFPLITIIRKPVLVLIGLLGIFILFLLLVFTPVGFPYSGNVDSPKPQRYWVYHASRTFRDDNNNVYKRDSGFFILHQDRNSLRGLNDVEELANAISLEDDCKRSLYCGLPLKWSLARHQEESTWIPAERPILTEPIDLTLNSKTYISKTTIRYSFTAGGPDSMELYLSARASANITSIDLVPNLPNPKIWNNRPMYIILYGWAKEKTAIKFSVDVKVPETFTGLALDIAVVGKYIHAKTNIIMPGYQKFLDQFSDWTDVVPMLSAYESWVY